MLTFCKARADYIHKKPARLTASRGTIKEFFKTYTIRYSLDV